MKRVLFRILLLAGAAVYIWAVIINFIGQWAVDHPTPENLRWGLRWNPGNPQLWTRYGKYLLFRAEGFQPQEAADAFLRAARMNPLDPENWDGLANAYLQMGDYAKAEAALRAGLAAMAHSPQAAWRLANFLILEGRANEAIPHLRTAAASSPEHRPGTYELGWKILADPNRILRELVPASFEARCDYLRFLLERKKLPEAYDVWRDIRRNRSRTALELGHGYIDALAGAGLGTEAARVWNEILEDSGRQAAKPTGELLTNGDFEFELPNAGLDWRLASGEGFQIELDNFVPQHGSRSLRVTFDPPSNLDFAGVWQLVPVEPNHEYRLRGYIKTENVGSDRGVQLCVAAYAAPPEENFQKCGENRVGSNPWSLDEIDLRSGPHTRLLWVGLRRFPSKKLNNLIQGKAWVDNFSLQEVRQ